MQVCRPAPCGPAGRSGWRPKLRPSTPAPERGPIPIATRSGWRRNGPAERSVLLRHPNGYRVSMEHSGDTPGNWTNAPDLAGIALGPGPFVTVQMAIDAAVENASQHNLLRWRGVRDELAAAGAPEKVLEEIGELVPEAHHEGQTLIAI